MDIISIILLAIGLAMDCLAVSIAQGLATDKQEKGYSPRPIEMAVLFGLFQGGMPLIGYYAGNIFASFFNTYAPWIALGLLAAIGGKMVWEALHEEDKNVGSADWSHANLLLLAIATSIDALATGVVFIPYPNTLWIAVTIIGLTSLVLSLTGYVVGKKTGERLHLNVTLAGGLILIAIGLKIWIQGVCL